MIKKFLCSKKASDDPENNSFFSGPIRYSLMVSAGLSPMSKTVSAPILLFGLSVIIGLSKFKFGP